MHLLDNKTTNGWLSKSSVMTMMGLVSACLIRHALPSSAHACLISTAIMRGSVTLAIWQELQVLGASTDDTLQLQLAQLAGVYNRGRNAVPEGVRCVRYPDRTEETRTSSQCNQEEAAKTPAFAHEAGTTITSGWSPLQYHLCSHPPTNCQPSAYLSVHPFCTLATTTGCEAALAGSGSQPATWMRNAAVDG